ncbi:hypothetical protein P167DRAFT_343707 [Morchella conica CCBAS932]|uniref:Uncharacterized protein n=1 Tax=Morchella conica CCBAS932 TaxID=1392247 RepID=A0A3N4KD58_9PEZI|nr:hypothetical protein P167DRAFT_343707 [Morchella conica CCBAS932]
MPLGGSPRHKRTILRQLCRKSHWKSSPCLCPSAAVVFWDSFSRTAAQQVIDGLPSSSRSRYSTEPLAFCIKSLVIPFREPSYPRRQEQTK